MLYTLIIPVLFAIYFVVNCKGKGVKQSFDDTYKAIIMLGLSFLLYDLAMHLHQPDHARFMSAIFDSCISIVNSIGAVYLTRWWVNKGTVNA